MIKDFDDLKQELETLASAINKPIHFSVRYCPVTKKRWQCIEIPNGNAGEIAARTMTVESSKDDPKLCNINYALFVAQLERHGLL